MVFNICAKKKMVLVVGRSYQILVDGLVTTQQRSFPIRSGHLSSWEVKINFNQKSFSSLLGFFSFSSFFYGKTIFYFRICDRRSSRQNL